MKALLVGMAAVLSVSALPAFASSDFSGAAELQRGDYAAAERVIRHQLEMWPGDADLLLNLATVYRRTGRSNDARAVYSAVLARPEDVIDLSDRTSRSSHVVARIGLSALNRAQLTAR